MAKLNKDTFIEALKTMTILEVKELVDAMKEEFGIDPTAVAAAPAGGAAAGAAAEQTEFDVILVNDGGNKIPVIKVVNTITGLGLAGSKDLVTAVPSTIKEKVSKAEAEDLKAQLQEAGATVEIK